MSTTDASSNIINISESSQYFKGKCNLKCDYAFLYKLSSCNVYNDGNMLMFSYDNNPNGNPQATYNGVEYTVYAVLITNKSVHLFNGQQTPSELIIIHFPVASGNTLLYVSIPIISIADALSSLITPSSQLVNDMIEQSLQLVPNISDNATLNLPSYSLEHVVPKKPYFTYTYSDTFENAQWIVYGVNNAIQIKETLAEQLKKIVPYDSDISIGDNNLSIFMSQSPPLDLQPSSSSDEIYIDCQPTGSSTEEEKVTYVSSSNNQSSVMFFIYVIFFLIVLLVIYMIFSYIMHPNKDSLSFASIRNQIM